MKIARGPQSRKTLGFDRPAAHISRARLAVLRCEQLETRWLLAGDMGPLLPVRLEDVLIASPMVNAYSVEDEVATPFATTSPTGYNPSKIRSAYDIDDIFFGGGSIAGDGTGQTIAIVNAFHTPTALADLTAFSNQFGLPMPPTFTQVAHDGTTNYPGTNSNWALETLLDIQWAHAIAPGASILLVEAASASLGNLLTAVDYARSQPGVSVISLSWGLNEFASEASYDFHFTAPTNHANVSYMAASGDNGAPGSYPAYSPNIMAVGGTSVTINGSGVITNETSWSGSGGGISLYESQPSWQSGFVTQSATQRTMPDVAFDADPNSGVPVYDSFNNAGSAKWVQVGGTSLSSPVWAGFVAIADQGRDLAGLPTLDIPELMTAIYAMPDSNFNDITISGGGPANAPEVGYDLVTGRGTPKSDLVVSYLVGLGSVTGTVFDDANGNMVLDGESGLAGWTVFADLDEDAVLDPLEFDTFASADVPKAIPSLGTVTSNQLVSGLAGDITDVNVTLNISHSRPSDLIITLISPTGTHVTLANNAGNTADNFTNTTFDDSAAISVSRGIGPFSGSYHPDEMLLDLFSENPNGTWQLEIQDTMANTSGTLNSWSLDLITGDRSTTTLGDGSYYLADLPDGTYQIRQITEPFYDQTAPISDFYTVPLGIGEHLTEQDFGNQSQLPNESFVVGRHIFYNQSVWDGNNDAIDAVNDNAAIATDKTAYLPGAGLAVPANATSFSRGITGIMIEFIAGSDLSGITLANVANNFVFKVGNNNSPSTWVTAPVPSAVSVSPGGGVSGTDRVTITWASGSIVNTWLQVQVLATPQTGLGAPDIFFWGNRIGDSGTGTPAATFDTTTTDAAQVFATLGAGKPITDLRDYNRDGQVNTTDAAIVFANLGNITRINIGTAGPFAPEGDGDAGIASALASTAADADSASPFIEPSFATEPSIAALPSARESRWNGRGAALAAVAAWHSFGNRSRGRDGADELFELAADDDLLGALASILSNANWRRR